MIERLASEILQDEYFITLNNKASRILAQNIFGLQDGISLSEKEFIDILRFADILSNANNPTARNRAYRIIALLNNDFKSNPYYQTFSHSVLARIGNFPGIDFLKTKNNNNSELPFEIELQKRIKEFIQTVPGTDDYIFTDSQFELYNKLISAKHFSFSGPTSMGKSFVIKSFIRKILENKPPENIVIMVPTRALINQFSFDLKKELKTNLEQNKYVVFTNSNISKAEEQHYIFILTPERLLSFLSQKDNPPFGFLFIDEAHKLAAAKDTRAVTAFTAISRALRVNPNLNLYFSAPNVSNPEVFLKLFNKDEKLFFRTNESPVSQNLFFVDLLEKQVTHYLDTESYQFKTDLLNDAVNENDIFLKIGANESNIIYCSSRFDAVDKAAQLYKAYTTKEIHISKKIKRVTQQIKGYIHKDYYLSEFLNLGIGYHFGNLPQMIRNKVEMLFKEKEIQFLFCTSTLLEGVNLPARNVFILNNRNGRNPFDPIDFWNLAGRAGRLKHELSGNIICIKQTDKEWKNYEKLFSTVNEIKLSPSVDNYIDKKLKKIEQILNENTNIKNEPEIIKDILKYIANIINIDTLEINRANYQSEIIKKLIIDNKDEIVVLAKRKTAKIEVPSSVLNCNQSINIQIQNDVYLKLIEFSKSGTVIKLPSKVNYEVCKKWLYRFYELYNWSNEEKRLKHKNKLDYYAVLMNQWINGIPLSQIINEAITYYHHNQKKVMTGYKNGEPCYEIFNNSIHHKNILIGNVIDDIENVLRFLFEKYFNNYYTMLIEIYGEAKAGVNWAAFLEYGTQNPIIISLQNYGLSRHSSNYIFRNYFNCLEIDSDKLLNIKIQILQSIISKDDIEYEEISSILF